MFFRLFYEALIQSYISEIVDRIIKLLREMPMESISSIKMRSLRNGFFLS